MFMMMMKRKLVSRSKHPRRLRGSRGITPEKILRL